jgi:monomeric sarcosine oxidase
MQTWDCIVLGTGGVGSAALYHLARRGLRVLGIDRFPPGHDRGSSHGQTRLIRMAYFEHPSYVPLLRRAYELWEDLERQAGRKLYHEVGLLQIGSPEGAVVRGVLASAREHSLQIEKLTGPELKRRHSGLRVPDPYIGLFEPRAGYLEVEPCVQAHADLARRAGAELQIGAAVLDWKATATGVTVRTDRATHSAARLIISAGAWAPALLPMLGIKFEVVRKPLYWYEPETKEYDKESGFPAFIFETSDGFFYGLPRIDNLGVKVAEHSGGHPVPDPLQLDRSEDPAETRRLRQFLDDFTPGVGRQLNRFEVCLYTLSPDRHFIVDMLEGEPQVVFAAGLSGHGFKFTPVLGALLADLAVDGRSQLGWQFLRGNRPGLREA